MATLNSAPIRPQRRFAPIGTSCPTDPNVCTIGGVVFDMDGTLCKPQRDLFAQMRDVLGINSSLDILDHVYAQPEDAQIEAMEKVKTVERGAMVHQVSQDGLKPIMDFLASREVRKGICTRNHEVPVHHLINTFIPDHKFEPIITRDFHPTKPHPAGIQHISSTWGLPDASTVIMVGDSIDDMTAGRLAGAVTVLVAGTENRNLESHKHTDIVIESLDELIPILEGGFQVAPATME